MLHVQQPPGMFWIFVFLTVIFLFLFQLYVLQDAITNMDTATALVNASKYFFPPKYINIICSNIYHPPEKARILSELLLLLPHQNFWFMVSKDHIFWPDKVENLSVKLRQTWNHWENQGGNLHELSKKAWFFDGFLVGTRGAVGGSNWQSSSSALPCFVAKVHHKFWTCPAASFPRQKLLAKTTLLAILPPSHTQCSKIWN